MYFLLIWGSSAAMHYPCKEKDDNKKPGMKRNVFINLADKLYCPYVRVFPNQFPKDRDRDRSFEINYPGIEGTGRICVPETNVSVLLESHGELIYTKVSADGDGRSQTSACRAGLGYM